MRSPGETERHLSSLLPLVTRMLGLGRIGQDLSAVQAALTLPYSNGQTEGQVTRLKLLKRQMYGRANLDLLRQRVLYAT
jgi:transposase